MKFSALHSEDCGFLYYQFIGGGVEYDEQFYDFMPDCIERYYEI